jgi:hypothetical protein
MENSSALFDFVASLESAEFGPLPLQPVKGSMIAAAMVN